MPRDAVVKVYKFDELTGEGKKRAHLKLADMQTAFLDWWDSVFEMLKEDLAEVGVDTGKQIYFSADRERHAYCPDARFTDVKKFLRAAIKKGHKLTKAEIRTALSGDIALQNDGSRYPDMRVRLGDEYTDALDEFIGGFFHEFLENVDKEFDYLRSEEAVKEMAEANEYEFTEDGRLFHE